MISKWTTEHLKAVLDDPYTRGKNGHDYGPIKHELQREYEKRLEAIEEKPKKLKKDKVLHIKTNSEQMAILKALGGNTKGFETILEFFIANMTEAETLQLFDKDRTKAIQLILGQ